MDSETAPDNLPADVLTACKTVARTRGAAGLAELHAQLTVLPPGTVSKYFELVKFPVWLLVQQPSTPEQVRLAALQCMTVLVSRRDYASQPAVITATVTELTLLLDGRLVADMTLSDELVLATLSPLLEVFTNCPSSIIGAELTQNEGRALGYALSATLDHFTSTRGRLVRARAGKVLAAICAAVPNPAVLIPFLPGVASGVARVLTGDFKQGQQIFLQGLRVWQTLVTRALAVPMHAADSPADKLQALLEKILAVVSVHEAWRVRAGCATFCGALLQQSSEGLVYAMPALVETLVLLSADSYTEVADLSQQLLDEGSVVLSERDSTLPTLLRENLHALVLSLPRIVRGTQDEQRRALLLLRGYITFLGPTMTVAVTSPVLLRRLGLALLPLLELDTADLKLIVLKDPSVQDPLTRADVSLFRKHFKHLASPDLAVLVLQTCRELGSFGDIYGQCSQLASLDRNDETISQTMRKE